MMRRAIAGRLTAIALCSVAAPVHAEATAGEVLKALIPPASSFENTPWKKRRPAHAVPAAPEPVPAAEDVASSSAVAPLPRPRPVGAPMQLGPQPSVQGPAPALAPIPTVMVPLPRAKPVIAQPAGAPPAPTDAAPARGAAVANVELPPKPQTAAPAKIAEAATPDPDPKRRKGDRLDRGHKGDRLAVARKASPFEAQSLGPKLDTLTPNVQAFAPGPAAGGLADLPRPRRKPEIADPSVVLAAIPSPGLARPPPASMAPAACRALLSGLRVTAEAKAPVKDGVCGAADPFGVSALQAGMVTLSPPAEVNCAVTATLAEWMADDVQPAAKAMFGGEVSELRIADSYSCRGRNRVEGAKLSEHAFMNAVDIGAFKIGDRWITVEQTDGDTDKDRAFVAKIRAAACDKFMTVLGPGSDPYHANHLHLDLQQRKAKRSRYCH